MSTLMNRDELRGALERAIERKSANKSPVSLTWAQGSSSRQHLARRVENHRHCVAPGLEAARPTDPGPRPPSGSGSSARRQPAACRLPQALTPGNLPRPAP